MCCVEWRWDNLRAAFNIAKAPRFFCSFFFFFCNYTRECSAQHCPVIALIYYRKRGSASYIVREVRSMREWDTEREREREREERERGERDGSDVTLVAQKLAMNIAPFLAKTLKLAINFAPFFAKNSHLSIGEEFCTFPCQKFPP